MSEEPGRCRKCCAPIEPARLRNNCIRCRRCWRTTGEGEPSPTKARAFETCWMCGTPIELSTDQPIQLSDKIQVYCFRYNCRWGKSGLEYVNRRYHPLKDVATGEYITPQLHPPWLVQMRKDRAIKSGNSSASSTSSV